MICFMKKNKKKFIATILIMALGFLIWQEPILSKANGVDAKEKNNVEKKEKAAKATFLFGGHEGSRTLGLCNANAALSQLSYAPVGYYNIIFR